MYHQVLRPLFLRIILTGLFLGLLLLVTPYNESGAALPGETIRVAILKNASSVMVDGDGVIATRENGVAVAWHRAPFTLGCFGLWTDATREQHYDNLCKFDGRIVLAGEHASYLPAWQEGAVTSALDAIDRLHQRAVEKGATA